MYFKIVATQENAVKLQYLLHSIVESGKIRKTDISYLTIYAYTLVDGLKLKHSHLH